jgi:hypothetical protein
MPNHHKTVTRSLAAGLAVCAIAPGAALAVPATDGPPAAGSGRPGVSAQDYQSLDYRAPTQTGSRADGATQQDRRAQGQTQGRGTGGVAAPTAPQWPVNPQPIAKPHSVATTKKPSPDDGVDTGVWIAFAAAALVAGGIGFAGGQRLGTGRQRQVA